MLAPLPERIDAQLPGFRSKHSYLQLVIRPQNPLPPFWRKVLRGHAGLYRRFRHLMRYNAAG